jgi:hypothetical protein
MHADAHCDGFLARIEVYEPWNMTSDEFGIDAFFEVTDATHRRVRE